MILNIRVWPMSYLFPTDYAFMISYVGFGGSANNSSALDSSWDIRKIYPGLIATLTIFNNHFVVSAVLMRLVILLSFLVSLNPRPLGTFPITGLTNTLENMPYTFIVIHGLLHQNYINKWEGSQA